ncbi:MAG: DNA translocase FtsK [Candidatus Omnitrophota bacterium]|nr:MAG: DNA translocase FtsK [Candidatus Omnitrophota bacterium]
MKQLSSFLKSTTFLFLATIILLSLVSYTHYDISFLSAPVSPRVHNFIGIGGAYLAFVLFFVFGYASYFLPFYLLFLGLDRMGVLRFYGLGRSKVVNIVSFLFFIVFLSAFIGLFGPDKPVVFESSGMVGFFLISFFKKYLGMPGSFITLLLFLVISSLLLFGFFFVDVFLGTKSLWFKLLRFFKRLQERPPKAEKRPQIRRPFFSRKREGIKTARPQIKVYTPKMEAQSPKITRPDIIPPTAKSIEANKEEVKKKIQALESQARRTFDSHTYKLPSPDILKVPPLLDYREVKEDIKANIKNLEETLSDFGVGAKVVSVQKGPVVTMYELQPTAGVKIQKISVLADDIALAMKSSQVRIIAPLPGRGTVGVEIPNQKKHLVFLREVLEEKSFIGSSSKLTLTIGKDVSGNPVIANLKDMPHLLIAGTTGSGKTVCVNSLITSILFKSKPDEVKFILVDPKMVELAPFAGIPHLLCPIISEAKKAFVALSWAVEEMEKRYHLLADEGVRNIDMYNKREQRLPYILIVVDELADLMVIAKDNIETAIQRLAQLSRAVGIHLILATQRPSVDVITGVIKANFPARISFKVSSKVDSRTVLDMMGADKLLGKGDLLFLKPGAVKLIRAQGAFIDDEDIEHVTNFIRAQGAPVYEEGILEGEKKRMLSVSRDELFEEAAKVVLQSRQASASMLQRRLRVGYTRAARLLDLMEEVGIVGPFCGSKPREILVDTEEYLKEKGWV